MRLISVVESAAIALDDSQIHHRVSWFLEIRLLIQKHIHFFHSNLEKKQLCNKNALGYCIPVYIEVIFQSKNESNYSIWYTRITEFTSQCSIFDFQKNCWTGRNQSAKNMVIIDCKIVNISLIVMRQQKQFKSLQSKTYEFREIVWTTHRHRHRHGMLWRL